MGVKASFMKAEGKCLWNPHSELACPLAEGEYLERTCWDTQDCELCLAWLTPKVIDSRNGKRGESLIKTSNC